VHPASTLLLQKRNKGRNGPLYPAFNPTAMTIRPELSRSEAPAPASANDFLSAHRRESGQDQNRYFDFLLSHQFVQHECHSLGLLQHGDVLQR
jgi:hypothetical protein